MNSVAADPRKKLASRWIGGAATVAILALVFWLGRKTVHAPTQMKAVSLPPGTQPAPTDKAPTQLWAHNVELRKGPHFRVFVRWIRGRMLRTRQDVSPSFDEPESFVLEIQKGMVDARLADVAEYLNSGQKGKPPLTGMKVGSHEGELQITGTAHKVIPIPVRLDGTLEPMPDGRMKFHLKKLNVLKIPMKGLLGLFHLGLDDLMPKSKVEGMQVSGNDIYFNTQMLLPPPHIRGSITSVQLLGDTVRVIYGDATRTEEELAQWHNFLRLSGGTVSFGKLTMRQADLTLIDATEDQWFDLDLTNYQTQLVYGTTRITSRAGVEVYMPDLEHLPPEAQKAAHGVTLDWLKNRDTTPPLEEIVR